MIGYALPPEGLMLATLPLAGRPVMDDPGGFLL